MGSTSVDAIKDAGPLRAPGAAYELCGSKLSCQDGLTPHTVSSTCVCTRRCDDGHTKEYNAPGCPPPADGLGPAYCDAYGWCVLPCSSFAETTGCPDGLACGVSRDGLGCITTPNVIESFRGPDRRDAIHDFELYGACRTFEPPVCPQNDLGTQYAVHGPGDCFCSAHCFGDDQCPQPPASYGRAVCLRADFPDPTLPGYCALACSDSSGSFDCPPNLRCIPAPAATCDAAFYYRAPHDEAVCRRGIYRHGNGDDRIEPGELYGPQLPESQGCAPGLGTTTEGGGRCIATNCCSDEDCPLPPPGYGSPRCWDNDCYLSCSIDSDCPEGGYHCKNVGSAAIGSTPILVCD